MKIQMIKLTSIDDAVRSGPFRRFSRFRSELVKELYGAPERSDQTDADLIAKINTDSSLENLQGFLDLLLNPALKYIEYKEFIIPTPDAAAIAELRGFMQPYVVRPGVMVKGTLIEPIEFKGRTPIKYRVVAYDDLINVLKARYHTVTVNIGC